jgi:mannose-6-phosphate isomerase-like protein (cupin superfamily)
MVTLKPGKSVGSHCTDDYEELVIVLNGYGEASIADGKTLRVRQSTALYIPPRTEHDIKNVGTVPLTYVYVVAKSS